MSAELTAPVGDSERRRVQGLKGGCCYDGELNPSKPDGLSRQRQRETHVDLMAPPGPICRSRWKGNHMRRKQQSDSYRAS